MIREHEGKWRFRIFFQETEGGREEGGKKNLNIDRNREGGLLLPGSDRNRISKGVENARVYVERRSHRTRSNRAENLNALFFFFSARASRNTAPLIHQSLFKERKRAR